LVTAPERSVIGKITRSGLDTRKSRPPASTIIASDAAMPGVLRQRRPAHTRRRTAAARLLLEEDPARARELLLSVEETGQQALAKMRRLLGILRGNEQSAGLEPHPGVADIGRSWSRFAPPGSRLTSSLRGPQALPPGIDLAAYLVVQEALTNALTL
jgi:hypothetical protein